MLKVIIEKNRSYSESCQMKPKFDIDMAEESFLRAKIGKIYPGMDEMLEFCIELRKFIRRSAMRSLINNIDYSCIQHARKNLWVAESILFDEIVVRKQCFVTTFDALPSLGVKMDGWGYTILAYEKPVVHKRFKYYPSNSLLLQNRLDRLRNEIQRFKIELTDGYY